jgi:hypothetical protein
MRMFEQPRFEALVHTARGRAHYAGKQPNASIEQDHRAKLAARQDIVADGDGLDSRASKMRSSKPSNRRTG